MGYRLPFQYSDWPGCIGTGIVGDVLNDRIIVGVRVIVYLLDKVLPRLGDDMEAVASGECFSREEVSAPKRQGSLPVCRLLGPDKSKMIGSVERRRSLIAPLSSRTVSG